jgi:hypothetical protein
MNDQDVFYADSPVLFTNDEYNNTESITPIPLTEEEAMELSADEYEFLNELFFDEQRSFSDLLPE